MALNNVRLFIVEFDIAAVAGRLTQSGARLRGEIVSGPGGKQVLLDDPSGNPVELFEPNAA